MKKKILIVDDEIFISEQLNAILLDLDYEVSDIKHNAKKAIESLKNNPPDLAILDINMHGENQGFEIARYIKDNMDIPYIFLTSFADKSTVDEASELKPNGYVLKPFNEQNIYSTLKVVFSSFVKSTVHIQVKIGHDSHKVKIDDILWLQASDKYIEIFTIEKKYVKRIGIDDFIKEHNLKTILRVHRSFAVNTINIESVIAGNIIVSGQEIPISKKYEVDFNSLYFQK